MGTLSDHLCNSVNRVLTLVRLNLQQCTQALLLLNSRKLKSILRPFRSLVFKSINVTFMIVDAVEVLKFMLN